MGTIHESAKIKISTGSKRYGDLSGSGGEGLFYSLGVPWAPTKRLDRCGDVAQFFGEQSIFAIIDRNHHQAWTLLAERGFQGGA